MFETTKGTGAVRSLALTVALWALSSAALAAVPTKAQPPSLKTLAQSRLGAFTKQGTFLGVIEAYSDTYGRSLSYLLTTAAGNYVGVPLDGSAEGNVSGNDPYSAGWLAGPYYSMFESYDCTGIPIIDSTGDGAIILGVLPARAYKDSSGQDRIAYSTSTTTQLFAVHSTCFGVCQTSPSSMMGYKFSGTIPVPSQIVGKRIP